MTKKQAPIKVKATTIAWATDDYGIESLLGAMEKGNSKGAINSMSFYHSETMTAQGWVKVGTATIEVEILPISELQSQQLATLVAQLEKERAESQVRQNTITDKISKLQALTFSGEQE